MTEIVEWKNAREEKPKEHEYDNYCSNCGRYMDRGN